MQVNKKYTYKVVGNASDEDTVKKMNELGEFGWRFIAMPLNGPGVVMELEGVRTDKDTAGSFQRAGLGVKGEK